jgi:hypothetical protein
MHSDHKRAGRFMSWLLLSLPIASFAGPAAVVKQTADVRASPSASAQQVTEAPASEPVEILNRRGGWYEVSSTSGWRGWVRLAALKITSATQKKPGVTRGMFEPAANIGVRGLDEAALSHAQPDYAALTRLRQYRSTPQDADRFAAELARTREGSR